MRKLLAVLLCALFLVSATASAQRVLSFATLAPAGSTWMRVFDASNRELRRRTGGQLSIRWYAGGVQGDESEVVRKIRSGRLDGAAITAVGLGQIHRPVLAFQLPGIFSTATGLTRARDALRSDLQTAFVAQGFDLLGFGSTGAPRMLSTRQIRTPGDLRQTHPWQWRDDLILPALYAETGATGVSLQVPEVLSAIQTNRVDTVIASPLVAISLQWAGQMHFMSERPDSASLGAMVISHSVLSSLPPDQQQIVREVTQQYDILLSRNVSHDDDAAAQTLQQRGVQIVQLNDAERAQWASVFAHVRTRLAGTIADAAWIQRVEQAGR
jgi:TRAP-type C4-dicarboxylate transport system substrate-binding protein